MRRSSHQRRRKEVLVKCSVRTMGLVSEPLSDGLVTASVVHPPSQTSSLRSVSDAVWCKFVRIIYFGHSTALKWNVNVANLQEIQLKISTFFFSFFLFLNQGWHTISFIHSTPLSPWANEGIHRDRCVSICSFFLLFEWSSFSQR